MRTRFQHEELWEPWMIEGEDDFRRPHTREAEIPDSLIERFKAARAEMEAVWQELRTLTSDD